MPVDVSLATAQSHFAPVARDRARRRRRSRTASPHAIRRASCGRRCAARDRSAARRTRRCSGRRPGASSSESCAADDVVGERARAEQDLDARRARQLGTDRDLVRRNACWNSSFAVRHRRALERRADVRRERHRARQEAHRLAGRDRQRRRRCLELFERQVHRLERRLVGADQRAERLEAQVPVQLRLAERAGNDGQVVSARAAVADDAVDQSAEDRSPPVRRAGPPAAAARRPGGPAGRCASTVPSF